LYKRLGGPQDWTGAENLTPHRDSIPVRPARNDAIPTSYPSPQYRSGVQPKAEHDEDCVDDCDNNKKEKEEKKKQKKKKKTKKKTKK